MLYKVNYTDGVLEFVKNKGRVFLEAPDPQAALKYARELFEYTRNERVQCLGEDQYLVSFKVALDYRLPLVHQAERAIPLLRTREKYDKGRYVDRYIVASVFRETGKPEYLTGIDVKAELRDLRKAAVVSREVPNIVSFIDIDISIYNYIELNGKEGFHSKVVRKSR